MIIARKLRAVVRARCLSASARGHERDPGRQRRPGPPGRPRPPRTARPPRSPRPPSANCILNPLGGQPSAPRRASGERHPWADQRRHAEHAVHIRAAVRVHPISGGAGQFDSMRPGTPSSPLICLAAASAQRQGSMHPRRHRPRAGSVLAPRSPRHVRRALDQQRVLGRRARRREAGRVHQHPEPPSAGSYFKTARCPGSGT